MRLSTQVCVGIRNVGDARDQGDFFTGTLKDALAWQINKMQSVSMAKRVEVVYGRDEAQVRVGLDLSRSTLSTKMGQYSELFADILSDDSLIDTDSIQPSASGEVARSPHDDWKE